MKKTKNASNKSTQIKKFIEAQIKEPQVLTYGEGEDRLEIKVYRMIPFSKRAEMVKEIIDTVFMNDGTTVFDYSPEYLKLAHRYAVISYFTDFTLPKKVDDMWLILNYTTLYDDVVSIVGEDIQTIFNEANEGIIARRNYLSNKTDINVAIEKITKSLDALQGQINPDDVGKALEMVKDIKGMAPEDIVKAVFKIRDNKEVN